MLTALKIIGIALLSLVGLFVAIVLLYALFLVVVCLCVSPTKEYKTRNNFYERFFDLSAFLVTKLFLIKVVVTGREKIPEGRFLFVCNHRSNFDPILSRYVLWKQDVAFVSKPQNFKIPVARNLINRCRFLSIDRENPRSSMKTLLKAIDYIKADQGSIGIYPEGTRSKESNLLPFHDGVFKIAQKANVPVLVGVLTGTEQIRKRKFLKRVTVHLDFVEVLMPQTGESSHELSEKARALILSKINEREGGRYEVNEVSSPENQE